MSTCKKIAIVSAVFPPYKGGIGNVAHNHARLLAERGHKVTVFTPSYAKASEGKPDYDRKQILKQSLGNTPRVYSGQARDMVQGDGFSIELLKPVIKYGNAAWMPFLKKRLKEFDVVILQYPFFGGMRVVYSAKKKYDFKLIVNYNMDVVASGLKGLVFWYAARFFLPRIVKIADVVLASSDDYAKHSDLRHFWKDNDPKFQILPIGVDASRFKPAETDNEFRKNLNVKPDEKIILFVGGLDKAHYFKGVEYLIASIQFIRHAELASASVLASEKQAMKRSQILNQVQDDAMNQAQDDGYKIVIVGHGELQQEYRALAEELGVKDRVLFTGGINDESLIKLYQMAYATVLPSIDQSESFGIVLVESMACGTPVIASDLPGVRSVYENGITGFSVKHKNEKALAEKISFILDNPVKRDEMSKACVRLVAEKYDWEKIGERLMRLI